MEQITKSFLCSVLFAIVATGAHAQSPDKFQTCPSAEQVFVKRGNQYIVVPPAGWQFTADWPSHLDSADVKFELAAWGADLHPPTNADNHVRCYYGNPDLTTKHGVAIETDSVVDESRITANAQWK